MSEFKEIEKQLQRLLVCTFGYYEVEEEVKQRCIEAIKEKDMGYLKKDLYVYCSGDGTTFEMKAGMVCLILYRYGIWQYVKSKIEKD